MKKTVRFPKKKCTDHLGNEFPSIKEMCSHWGIQPETYTRRIKVYHLSVEEALTRPVKPNGGQSCRDPHADAEANDQADAAFDL